MPIATQNKIIFTGPVGAGKSTAINAISDIQTVTTEARASDLTGERKETTTVALDYGVLRLSDSERVHLYGTPGQERFGFMWDILTEGGIGLVVLVDNARPAPFEDLQFFLDAFKDFIASSRVVIGVTRMDVKPYPSIDDYHRQMHNTGIKTAIFEVDARRREDVGLLVQALLYSLDPGLVE